MMRVMEIYESIQGELPNIGCPCLIVRFAGCNVQCPYCDAPNNEGKEMSVFDLAEIINNTALPEVLITGGEPLLQKDLGILLTMITKPVVVETNGTVLITSNLVPYIENIVMDVKLFKDTFETERTNLKQLGPNDVLKFVYSDQAELGKAFTFILSYCLDMNCMFVFSPVDNQNVMADQILDWQKRYPKLDIRLQTQIHKHLNLA